MAVIRWGILGPGRIAHKFAQDLRAVPDAVLHAVASSDQARAEAFAAEYGAPHVYGSYEELLSCPDLDVVYVATTHTLHYEATLLCINAGIPVLCEKPFAINGRQVREMVELARRKKVFLMEALWTRFLPTVEKALDLVRSGAIGRPVGLRADFGFRAPFSPERRLYNKSLGGGSLLDIGIYPLFLSYLFLGKPQTITASAVLGETGVDEQCGMVLTYEPGDLAVLHSTLLTKTDTDAYIYGETGSIYLTGRFQEGKEIVLKPQEGEPETFAFPRETWGYNYEAAHVMDCLREGRTESPVWSLDDSLNLMGLLDTIREKTGIWYAEDAVDQEW